MTLLQAASALPPDLFTANSVGTLAGATGIVVAICAGIQRAFNYNPRWLALVIAVIITIMGAIITKAEAGVMRYLVGVINGFLVYASATGANQIIAGTVNAPNPTTTTPGTTPQAQQRSVPKARGFFSPWW